MIECKQSTGKAEKNYFLRLSLYQGNNDIIF